MNKDIKESIWGWMMIINLLASIGIIAYGYYILFVNEGGGLTGGLEKTVFILLIYVVITDLQKLFANKSMKIKQEEMEMNIALMQSKLSKMLEEKRDIK
jgi:uncharacterized membrane protein